ncbi:alcohol dehydrogenase catalytic domain-containing protein [Paractinoplanes rishiriensis]|uniref:Alcohol dehydrogenase n=1 Tax=Paractinoplanes rishiriensis TaxID=1050105 RepID=A0A919JSJ3_9ACTN|nr:alcohol dehydrogenase catalytic domain-containing protein [Actinoplanes rishiriensis]GIE92592.1 alcohol dehydrogenase [Actinoplanes rishiriensis]
MKAQVYDAIGAPPEWRDVPAPECPPDGAVIAVRASGVCRSDWHAWRGHDPVSLPHVPGHEFAGVIAEVGADVGGFAVGDRVTAPFVNGCGRCDYCVSGAAQVCPSQTQPGFTHPGSFAELVVVRAADTNLVRLPDAIDFVAAASLGCRFATAFRALRGVGAGSTVAVFGCGGVGLSAVMIGVALGARVLAVDPSPAALALAAELGAEARPSAEAFSSAIAGEADVAIDAFGSAGTALASVRSLRRGGRHVQVGLMLGDDARTPLPWDLVVAHELEIRGSHGMAAVDYPPMLDLIVAGRLDPRRLVGAVIPLEQAGSALAGMDEPVARAGGIVVAVHP